MKLYSRKSGSGEPLVILHGLFGISDNWAGLAKQWSEHFTVYTLDLRNHGQSGHSEEWSYWLMAEDVLQFFEEESLKKVNLLGHSMGGKVAMQLALDFPEALSKLIVAEIGPKQYPIQNQDVVNALLKVHPEKLASRKEAEAILSKELKDNGTVQFLLKNLYWKEESEKKLAWRFNLDVLSKKLEMVAQETEAPEPCMVDTLFLRGDKSNYILPEDEAEIKRKFPNSTIQTIKDAGHWLHADQPKAMYEAVLNFCK